ncbi:MAG: glycerol transporter, partial [Pleopsidium flavum]
MALLGLLRRLYSLDTLDTRFTTSSRTPLKQRPSDTQPRIDPAQSASGGVETSNGYAGNTRLGEKSSDISPSRWKTPEFFVYYFIFITVVPMMFKVTYDVSK